MATTTTNAVGGDLTGKISTETITSDNLADLLTARDNFITNTLKTNTNYQTTYNIELDESDTPTYFCLIQYVA